MKKLLILVCILFAYTLCTAQITRQEMKKALFSEPTTERYRIVNANACYVFNTAEDYYANKPIAGMEWRPWKSASKIELVTNGKEERKKYSEMEGKWFSDQEGFLMRNVKNTLYTVVVDGPICYYVEFYNGEVNRNADSTFSFSTSMGTGKYFEYYSETLKGDVKSWSDKLFRQYLKQFNLEEQFENEKVKREMKDSVWGFESKKLNKRLKYLKIINEKLAVK
jgi:hypothetical protein